MDPQDLTTTPQEDATLFAVVLSYAVPLATIDASMAAHRAFLDTHFATGEFLASGPRVPRTGGVVLARAANRERVDQLIAEDPFAQQGLARHEVIAFRPTRGPFAVPLLNASVSVTGGWAPDGT